MSPDLIQLRRKHGFYIAFVNGFIWLKQIHPARIQRPPDDFIQWLLPKLRLACHALQHADILLGGADEGFLVATQRNDFRIAVIGQNPLRRKSPEPVKVLQMGIESFRLGDVGYGVFHRVAREQQLLGADPYDSCVIAMDIGFDQIHLKRAYAEPHGVFISLRWHDQWVDRGQAVKSAVFNRSACSRQVGRRAGIGNNGAIHEGRGACDMVQMPMAQDDGNFLCPLAFKVLANESAMLNRNMGIVDDRLVCINNRIAGNAEGKRPVIYPVITIGKTISRDTAIIIGIDVLGRLNNAQVFCHGGGYGRKNHTGKLSRILR